MAIVGESLSPSICAVDARMYAFDRQGAIRISVVAEGPFVDEENVFRQHAIGLAGVGSR